MSSPIKPRSLALGAVSDSYNSRIRVVNLP
jgi:hypothetical protein